MGARKATLSNVWLGIYRNGKVSPCIPLDPQWLLGSEVYEIPVTRILLGEPWTLEATSTLTSCLEGSSWNGASGFDSGLKWESVELSSIDRAVRSEFKLNATTAPCLHTNRGIQKLGQRDRIGRRGEEAVVVYKFSPHVVRIHNFLRV